MLPDEILSISSRADRAVRNCAFALILLGTARAMMTLWPCDCGGPSRRRPIPNRQRRLL